jgi:hypothetical protein
MRQKTSYKLLSILGVFLVVLSAFSTTFTFAGPKCKIETLRQFLTRTGSLALLSPEIRNPEKIAAWLEKSQEIMKVAFSKMIIGEPPSFIRALVQLSEDQKRLLLEIQKEASLLAKNGQPPGPHFLQKLNKLLLDLGFKFEWVESQSRTELVFLPDEDTPFGQFLGDLYSVSPTFSARLEVNSEQLILDRPQGYFGNFNQIPNRHQLHLSSLISFDAASDSYYLTIPQLFAHGVVLLRSFASFAMRLNVSPHLGVAYGIKAPDASPYEELLLDGLLWPLMQKNLLHQMKEFIGGFQVRISANDTDFSFFSGQLPKLTKGFRNQFESQKPMAERRRQTLQLLDERMGAYFQELDFHQSDLEKPSTEVSEWSLNQKSGTILLRHKTQLSGKSRKRDSNSIYIAFKPVESKSEKGRIEPQGTVLNSVEVSIGLNGDSYIRFVSMDPDLVRFVNLINVPLSIFPDNNATREIITNHIMPTLNRVSVQTQKELRALREIIQGFENFNAAATDLERKLVQMAVIGFDPQDLLNQLQVLSNTCDSVSNTVDGFVGASLSP